MKNYFRFIGVLCIIGFIIGAIVDMFYIRDIVTFLIFIACLIVGPSVGLLFISHAKVLESMESLSKPYTITTLTSSHSPSSDLSSEPDGETIPPSSSSSSESSYLYKQRWFCNYSVMIVDEYLQMGGKTFDLYLTSDVSVFGKEVKFRFFKKLIKIECDSSEEASELFGIIMSYSGKNKEDKE